MSGMFHVAEWRKSWLLAWWGFAASLCALWGTDEKRFNREKSAQSRCVLLLMLSWETRHVIFMALIAWNIILSLSFPKTFNYNRSLFGDIVVFHQNTRAHVCGVCIFQKAASQIWPFMAQLTFFCFYYHVPDTVWYLLGTISAEIPSELNNVFTAAHMQRHTSFFHSLV